MLDDLMYDFHVLLERVRGGHLIDCIEFWVELE